MGSVGVEIAEQLLGADLRGATFEVNDVRAGVGLARIVLFGEHAQLGCADRPTAGFAKRQLLEAVGEKFKSAW